MVSWQGEIVRLEIRLADRLVVDEFQEFLERGLRESPLEKDHADQQRRRLVGEAPRPAAARQGPVQLPEFDEEPARRVEFRRRSRTAALIPVAAAFLERLCRQQVFPARSKARRPGHVAGLGEISAPRRRNRLQKSSPARDSLPFPGTSSRPASGRRLAPRAPQPP
jgi:hypothetical protein